MVQISCDLVTKCLTPCVRPVAVRNVALLFLCVLVYLLLSQVEALWGRSGKKAGSIVPGVLCLGEEGCCTHALMDSFRESCARTGAVSWQLHLLCHNPGPSLLALLVRTAIKSLEVELGIYESSSLLFFFFK